MLFNLIIIVNIVIIYNIVQIIHIFILFNSNECHSTEELFYVLSFSLSFSRPFALFSLTRSLSLSLSRALSFILSRIHALSHALCLDVSLCLLARIHDTQLRMRAAGAVHKREHSRSTHLNGRSFARNVFFRQLAR